MNSAYVDVENTVGVDKVMDAATRAGIPQDTRGMERNLAFVLGVASPHALDLASSYSTFAARGQQVEPTVLRRVVGPNGGVLWESSPTVRQAFSSDVADDVNEALQSVVTNGTGSTAQGLDRPAAGKTGTTNGNMSAWFVGYTPQLAAAVMLVKDGADGQPVTLRGTGGMQSVTGGSFPADIWTAFMRAALEGQAVEEFTSPAGELTVSPSASASPSASVSPSARPHRVALRVAVRAAEHVGDGRAGPVGEQPPPARGDLPRRTHVGGARRPHRRRQARRRRGRRWGARPRPDRTQDRSADQHAGERVPR